MTLKILSGNKEVGKAKLYDNIVLDNFLSFHYDFLEMCLLMFTRCFINE